MRQFLFYLVIASLKIVLAQNWQIFKQYNLSDMTAIRADWNIEVLPPGWNDALSAFVDDPRTLFTRDGHVIIRAYRENGSYYSGSLISKQMFTPADFVGKRIRVEMTAKIPTQSGSWPALWMLGDYSTYGEWPLSGEIDLIEWVHQLGDEIKASLHWKWAEEILGTMFPIRMIDISNQYYTYGVEYSNYVDDEYAQFYIRAPSGSIQNGPKLNSSLWIWDDFPPCNYTYTAEAKRCSYAAPFDNRMKLIMNMAVGGFWGGCCGVQNSDYDAFDQGVEMEISQVTVYSATEHNNGAQTFLYPKKLDEINISIMLILFLNTNFYFIS